MIGLPSSVKIYLATEPGDMRRGIDSLAASVRRAGGDPFSGRMLFGQKSERSSKYRVSNGKGERQTLTPEEKEKRRAAAQRKRKKNREERAAKLEEEQVKHPAPMPPSPRVLMTWYSRILGVPS